MKPNQMVVMTLVGALSYDVAHAKLHSEHVPETDYSERTCAAVVIQTSGTHADNFVLSAFSPFTSGQF